MKFAHLSDLHLGIRVNDFNLIEDQKYILWQVLDVLRQEKPDGVIIAGDIYDKSAPSAEAVELFDAFLYELSKLGGKVFIISGNHDSAERLAFGGRLMPGSGVYLSPVYNGNVEPVIMEDEKGSLKVWMLPFLRPSGVRRFFPEAEITDYPSAIKTAVDALRIDTEERNVLITHQFVAGASLSDSEETTVGGTDCVPAEIFDGFDYVALGHIHGPQNVRENIRYCGTPLKYSFSEAAHKKSITFIEFGAKGEVSVSTRPLSPLHDMREITGSYEEVTLKSFYEGTSLTTDYVRVTLTDELDIPNAMAKLRLIYKNIMGLRYANRKNDDGARFAAAERVKEKTPLELFEELYHEQYGLSLSGEQKEYLTGIIDEIRRDEE